MVQIQDFSALRPPVGEKVTIPLNGVNYHAAASVPADLILSSAQQQSDVPTDIPEGMTMEQIGTERPDIAMKLGKAQGGYIDRIMLFLQTVLEPDSWAKWKLYMGPVPEGATPKARKEHTERMIAVAQVTAVYRALVAHYSGRPTEPSSSSPNGDGGAGGTSTAGAPAAE